MFIEIWAPVIHGRKGSDLNQWKKTLIGRSLGLKIQGVEAGERKVSRQSHHGQSKMVGQRLLCNMQNSLDFKRTTKMQTKRKPHWKKNAKSKPSTFALPSFSHRLPMVRRTGGAWCPLGVKSPRCVWTWRRGMEKPFGLCSHLCFFPGEDRTTVHGHFYSP